MRTRHTRLIAVIAALSVVPLAARSQTDASRKLSTANSTAEAPNWRPTPTALTAKCDSALARVRRQIASAVGRPLAERNLANSLKVIEDGVTTFWMEVSPLTFLYQVAPDSAVRAASASCDQKVQNFNVEATADPNIYATALALSKANSATTPEDRKLIAFYLEFGSHAGAGLDSATHEQVTALFKRLNDVQREFGIALSSDTTTITANDAGIAGFPAQFVATLKRAPNGQYIIPVNEATSGLVMRNATSAETREKYFRADSRRGGSGNVERLSQALAIRDSLAHLMGVPNWATYQLQIKMAKTPEKVVTFLNELDAKLLPKARAEQAERAALKKAEGDNSPYRPWDYAYYETLLRKKKYALDEQEIREYFPVDRVVSGVLDIYGGLLGVRFAGVTPADAWAPDVQEFSITDTGTGRRLGVVYLDLFPRPNKYNHFANWSLAWRILRPDGTSNRTIGAIVGNWPTPEPGKPSLLSHADVITFFHEFGHLMDGAFAASPYLTILNLRQDFGEAPSQMLENWMWRPEVLALVSRNVKTGKPLPKSLIDQMIAAKHMSDGIYWTQQIFYGLYDMTLASSPPTIDLTRTWYDLLPRVTANEAVQIGYPESSFIHLMGYDAGYYGYLWSKVLSQDMFTRFEKEGVLNPKTGMAYRHLVLEPGGLREPDELLQEFLGRPLSYDAFYRDLGIKRR